jgi:hypothetical protein
MPFEIRCPKCNAKLRFDEPPGKGEEIECPKCSRTFLASGNQTDKPAETKKEDAKKQKKPRAVTAKERVHFSPILLLLIVGTLVSLLYGAMFGIWLWLYLAGKSVDMLAAVPDNFNVISGVNVKAMGNYAKLKQEQDKYYNAEAQALYGEAAKKAGLDPDKSLRYFVVAREVRGNSMPTLMLFLTNEKFDPAKLGGGQVQPLGGRGGAQVCAPNPNLIAVAFGGNEQATLTAVASNAKGGRPKDGMHTKVGTAGMMAIRGHVWTIIRPVGGLNKYFPESAVAIKDDSELKTLREAFAGAKLFATWTSFGGQGIRFGAAMTVADADAAKALVKDMKGGPLGKADESEPPNQTKQVFSFLTQQKEFLQYLEYRYSGDCAYLVSKMENPEKARSALDMFNRAGRAIGGF